MIPTTEQQNKKQGYLSSQTPMGQQQNSTSQPPKPTSPPSQGYINPKTDLVENRMTNLLSKDNAYMKQAETAGMQQAAARGLQNSSIAVGAAEGARIQAALPIAQQDASLYGQSSLSKQGYLQNRGLQEQQHGFNRNLADQQFGFDTKLADQKFGHDRGLQQERYGFESQLQNDRQAHDVNLAGINHSNTMEQERYRTQSNMLLNDQQNTWQGHQNVQQQIASLAQNEQSQISAILRDPNMSAPQKKERIREIEEYTRAQINMLLGLAGLDSLGDLDFGNETDTGNDSENSNSTNSNNNTGGSSRPSYYDAPDGEGSGGGNN